MTSKYFKFSIFNASWIQLQNLNFRSNFQNKSHPHIDLPYPNTPAKFHVPNRSVSGLLTLEDQRHNRTENSPLTAARSHQSSRLPACTGINWKLNSHRPTDRPTATSNFSPRSVFNFSDWPTDRPTDRPTDSWNFFVLDPFLLFSFFYPDRPTDPL